MQLTIDVLPAPLGPMIENSSPSFTPKLTSVSARTPPKRSDTPRTSKACSTLPSIPAYSAKPAPDSGSGRIRLLRSQGAWRALWLAIDEINPVRCDGSTCFTYISRLTVGSGPIDFGIRLHRGRMLWPAPRAEGLLQARFGRAYGVIIGVGQPGLKPMGPGVTGLVRCDVCGLSALNCFWGSPGALLE